MKQTKCLQCGGQDFYKTVIGSFGNFFLVVKVNRFFGKRAAVRCAVCLSCGAVLLYLDENSLRKSRNRKLGLGDIARSGGQPEQISDEPNLRSNIIATHPSNLAFPNHVHRLIALKRSPGCMEFLEALLGVDPAFDRTMILLQDAIQVLDRAMATAPTKNPFFLMAGIAAV
jgi:hypothetical protein